jgi:hypothetical protein
MALFSEARDIIRRVALVFLLHHKVPYHNREVSEDDGIKLVLARDRNLNTDSYTSKEFLNSAHHPSRCMLHWCQCYPHEDFQIYRSLRSKPDMIT